MRKKLLISVALAAVFVGAGCVGDTAKSLNANVPVSPVSADAKVNSGVPDAAHVPVKKSAALGENVTLEVGDTVSLADGFSVTLTEINDSRCPAGAQCVWQGELAPVLKVVGGTSGPDVKIITLGSVRALQTIYAGYALALREAAVTSVKVVITKDASAAQFDERIRVTSLKAGALAASPLVVSGEARGSWYFEASFPVQLLDANGVVLARAPAQAKGDWMTDTFVPFAVTLIFPTPTTATGILVLKKDNPSGLPQNDASVSIPVDFTP